MKPYNGIVGKKIGSNVWLHKSSQHTLLSADEIDRVVGSGFEYDVVRIDLKSRKLTLIKCVDFDLTHEPVLVESLNLDTGKITKQGANPLIYHHKYLFVTPEYAGFCYHQSKQRGELWQSLSPRTRDFSSRIGRREFWYKWLRIQKLAL
ncbi:hypothetical protein [Vibrio sp. 10N.239.312.D08]|uniref:hypothetical protein n=1 Tax=Vibrio sp. 10N.239.312.D08 TaxID=3229978 RepID=UPI003552C965